MKSGRWCIALVVLCCFQFGCGSDTDPEKAVVEKDRIEKVGDAASSLGYDGESIDRVVREANDLSNDSDELAEEILNE